jgi:hypothetical protein
LLSLPRISFSTAHILTLFYPYPLLELSVSLSGMLLSSSLPALWLLLIFGCPNYRWNYLFKYIVVTPYNVVAFVIIVKCK